MTKNYEYIEQLLDSYFECQTTLEEEQILRAFYAQKISVPREAGEPKGVIPLHLLPYRKLFTETVLETSAPRASELCSPEHQWSARARGLDGSYAESLGKDFDQRILAQIGELEAKEPKHVTAKVVSMQKRLRPLYKAAACIAVILALGQAAQMPYYQSESEQQESLARSLEQLQQIQKDKSAVAKSDSIKAVESAKSGDLLAPLKN